MLKKSAKETLGSTQQYLPIKEIREGTVLLEDGSMKSIIMVSTLNFALKGEQEKESIIMGFQGFLNGLDFPIQVLSTSKKLDLSHYLSTLDALESQEPEDHLKIQLREYQVFINYLLEQTNIMEKRFYVVIPYYNPSTDILSTVKGGNKQAEVQAIKSFEVKKKELLHRVEQVLAGLSNIGLRCASLGTDDLLELYYGLYNPETSKNEKIKDPEGYQAVITKGES